MPDEKKAYGTSHGGQLFLQLQTARRAHRHAAHVYARTKKTDTVKYDAAVQQLETAAQAFTLAAAQYGMFSDCAAPANGPARDQWEKDIDPEPKR